MTEKKAFDFVQPKYPARDRNEIDDVVDRYKEEVENPASDRISRHVDREANKILEESVRKR